MSHPPRRAQWRGSGPPPGGARCYHIPPHPREANVEFLARLGNRWLGKTRQFLTASAGMHAVPPFGPPGEVQLILVNGLCRPPL
jgi:hypothetical protein